METKIKIAVQYEQIEWRTICLRENYGILRLSMNMVFFVKPADSLLMHTYASLNNGCAQCIDLDICCLTHGCLPLKRHTFVLTKKNENRQKNEIQGTFTTIRTHMHACILGYRVFEWRSKIIYVHIEIRRTKLHRC